MKGKAAILALAAWFAASAPALARDPDWLPVGETDELQGYIDVSSIARKGERASAWFLDNFFEPQILPGRRAPFQSRKSHLQFDCRKAAFAVEDIILFSEPFGHGRVVQKSKPKKTAKPRFEGVPDDSLLQDMMDFACRYSPEPLRPAPGTLII